MRNVPTQLVILEIAEGLKTLIADKNLSKIISDAYALSEEEQAKADEARRIIAESAKFLADLEEKAKQYSDINERIVKEEALKSSNAESLAALALEKKTLKSIESKNKMDAEANQKEAIRLSNVETALNERAEKLMEDEKKNAVIKEDLINRLNAIKAAAA